MEHVIDELWNNWMFRLNPACGELFHSNFLQVLLTEGRDKESDDHLALSSWPRVLAFAKLLGIDEAPLAQLQAQFQDHQIGVFREWKNLDLAIVAYEKNASRNAIVLFAVELKVKSYPNARQLFNYLDKMRSINDKAGPAQPTLVLLSLLPPPPDVARMTDVICADFGRLAAGFQSLPAAHLPLAPAREEYVRLCASLHRMGQHLQAALGPAMTLRQLKEMRKSAPLFGPLWDKLCSAYLCQLVERDMQIFGAPAGLVLVCTPGYSNQGTADFLWYRKGEEQGPARDGTSPIVVKVGVQVEGVSIRFMLSADGIQNSTLNARQAVEQALMEAAKTHGLFTHLNALLPAGVRSADDRSYWTPARSAMFKGGHPELGKPTEGRFTLTGFLNSLRFGHADYRLTFKADATLDEVAQLVACALRGELNGTGMQAFAAVLNDHAAYQP